MEAILGPHRGRIYAGLRIIAGLLFAAHGMQKVFGWFGGIPAEMNAVIWIAGIVELVGGLLIAVGFFTSWAAFLSSGQMAIAYFAFHQPNGLLPITNQGELAVLYCWIFLYIAARGDGPWSLGGSRKT